jgi:hypothetical protein
MPDANEVDTEEQSTDPRIDNLLVFGARRPVHRHAIQRLSGEDIERISAIVATCELAYDEIFAR